MINAISPMMNLGKADPVQQKGGGMEKVGKEKENKSFSDLFSDQKKVPETSKGPPKEGSPPGGKPLGKREKAISKFMDSFESEFEIPPKKLVEAMAELPPSLQDKSPMETATNVVDKLDLSDKDREKALGLYVGFLMQLQNIEQKAQVPPQTMDSMVASPALVSTDLQAKAKSEMAGIAPRMQALQAYKDLGEMGLPSSTELSGVPAADFNQAMAAQSQLETPLPQQTTDEAEELAAAGVSAEGLAKLQKLEEAIKDLGSDGSEEVQAPEAETADNGGLEKAGALKMSLPSGLTSASAMKEESAQSNLQHFNQQFDQSMTNAEGKAASHDFFANEVKKDDFKTKLGESLAAGMVGAAVAKGATAENVLGAQNLHGPVAASNGEHTPPIQQIINQAQVLIRDGGGEMKVQLNPEGLGVVNLKVALQDGKLTINMAADQKETKKILESSIGELKSNLNAHRFTVDNIHVDVVRSMGTENNAQNSSLQQDLSQQGFERQAQKQFWQQFQDNFGNKSRQEEWMDMASNPRIMKQNRYNPTGSIGEASAAPRAMNSQRLNRVA